MKAAGTSLLSKCFREKNIQIATIFSVCLLFAVAFFSQSYQATRQFQRRSIYGYHNGSAYDISIASAEALANHRAVRESGEMLISGMILSDDGLPVTAVGTVDAGFRDLERLAFLEGTYPRQADEIAMEHAALDLLHIPYRLGEEIDLAIQADDGAVSQRKYVLCGILQSYTTNWKSDGYPLCGAIAAELPGDIAQRHLFFYADYRNENQMRELSSLVSGPGRSKLVYNDYGYPLRLSSIAQIVEDGGVVLGAILFCCLLLIGIQISAYRRQLYRLRVLSALGVDGGKFKRMLFGQTIAQWAKRYTLCVALCSLICVLLVIFSPEDIRFRLSLVPYLLSGVTSFFVLLIGKAFQVSMLRSVPALSKGRDMTRYESGAFSPRRAAPITDYKAFAKVETRRNRKFFRVEFALGFLSMAVLFFCLYEICDSYRDYRMTSDIASYDYAWSASSPKAGLSDGEVSRIKNTANIDDVVYTSEASRLGDDAIYLRYEGQTDDPYRVLINESSGITDTDAGLRVRINTLPAQSPLWDYYIPDGLDTEAFLRGEIVILYLPELLETSYGYALVNTVEINNHEVQGETCLSHISVGDTLTIAIGDRAQAVTCGCIMRSFPGRAQTAMDFLIPGTVLMSETLYKHLFGMDEPRYNYVLAFGNDRLSYDVGDKIMSGITKNAGIQFENRRIEKDTAYTLFKTDALSLGGIALFLCVFAVMFIRRNRVFLLEVEEGRIALLRQLGCDQKKLSRIYGRYAGTIQIPLALLINAVAIPWLFFREYGGIYAAESFADAWRLVSKLALHHFPLALLLLAQGLYLCVLALLPLTDALFKRKEYGAFISTGVA